MDAPLSPRDAIGKLHATVLDHAQSLLLARQEVQPFVAILRPSSAPGGYEMAVIPVRQWMDGTVSGKNQVATLFQKAARNEDTIAAALVSEVWMSLNRSGVPHEDPGRMEGLSIECLAGDEQARSLSLIDRGASPVQISLGKLEFAGDDAASVWVSRFMPAPAAH